MVRKRKGVSFAENEAETPSERASWVVARERSAELLKSAQHLFNYLHGLPGGNDPSHAESCFQHADAIRYLLSGAIAVRVARGEARRKALDRTKAKRAKART
jgi:hypothetical protein